MEVLSEKPINVLLIEDNPGDAQLIREQLNEESGVLFHVESCDRLSRGSERLSEGVIDVVLLDLSLPDSHGFETLTKMKEHVFQVPIIVLTGLDDENMAVRAVGTGAQDYLVKGRVDGNLLVRSIRYAIERKRIEEALRESEEKYRDLVEKINDIIYTADNKGVVTYVSPAIESFVGYNPRETIGRHLRDFIHQDDLPRLTKSFQNLLAGYPTSNEYRIVTKSGEIRWIRTTSQPIFQEQTVSGVRGILSDITDRKRAEEALRESELQYRTTINSMGDAIHVVDKDLRVLLFNTAVHQWNDQFGLETDILGKSIFEIYPYLSDKIRDEYRHVFHTGKILLTEETTKVGQREYTTETRKIPVFENGSVSRVVTVIHDVTERKQAEEALRESEEKYRYLIDNSQDAIYLLYEGKFEIINKKFEELFGYNQDETNASDFNFMNVVAPESRGLIQERVKKVEEGQPVSPRYEFTALSREGKKIDVETSVAYVPYKGGIATQGILRDITERKQAEEAIRKRATRLGLIAHVGQKTTAILELNELLHQTVTLIGETFNYYNVVILLLDSDELVLRASTLPALQSVEGQVRVRVGFEGISGWVAGNGEPLIVPDVSKEPLYYAALREMETKSEMAVPIVLKGNVIGVLDAQSTELDAFSQNDVFTLQTLADQLAIAIENARLYEQASDEIVERKRIENFLEVERDKLRNILDNMNDSVIIEDENYNIVYQNRTSVDTEGEFIGQKCYAFFHGRKEPCPDHCAVAHFLKDQKETPFFHNPRTKDGRSWETIAVPIIDEKGKKAVLEVSRDVSEQKHLREQLLQSEKMSALGQLISGVAHELNNPLTGILGFSQLLLMSPDIPETTRHSLETINSEAERARKIVQNLLFFSRQRKTTKKKVLVNEMVGRALDLRAYEMRVNNIEVVRMFEADCPPIFADDHQLQQVCMNLIINAEQAMLEAHAKGRLEVTTQWDKERNVIIITFCDDGPGIAEDHLSKLFDPFFTTKPVGKGTGLGLSISYGILQEHGGTITASNENERGATFRIELPVFEMPRCQTESPHKQAQAQSKVAEKKILVVDDEVSVVELVKVALEGEGHFVEVAYDGDSALEKIKEDHFEAVVTDLKMPGKNGIDIYLYCKEKRPDLARRFLFLTGDVGSVDSLRFMEEQKVPYVSKPFDLKDMVSSFALLFTKEE